ncbi:MAG TPA: hypothetical protein PL163_17405 [Leptospiraceae bacterium]|nr:hypothetical protein [Leptospiraceae bacterium]
MDTGKLHKAALSDQALTDVMNAIDIIINSVPFLMNLSPEEKRTMFKLGDKSLGFIEKVVDYSEKYPDFIPNYIEKGQIRQEYELFKRLSMIYRKLNPLMENLQATQMEAGSELYEMGLLYYHTVKTASTSDIPNAKPVFDDLKTKFPGRSKQSVKKTEA